MSETYDSSGIFSSLAGHSVQSANNGCGMIFASIAICYIAWRIWRFTLCPSLYPDQPRQLPYLIPIVGHTIAFMRCSEKLYQRGNSYFQTTEPYGLTIGGKTAVVLRDTRDLNAIWRNTKDLSYDPFVVRILSAFGISEKNARKVVIEDAGALVSDTNKPKSLLASENPQRKSYLHLQSDWLKKQLLPAGGLTLITDRYHAHLHSIMHVDKFPRHFLSNMAPNNAEEAPKQVLTDLGKFCRYMLSHCAFRAFFGEALFEVEPDFARIYQTWEDNSWKVFYNYPSFLSTELHSARRKTIDSLAQYYKLSPEGRPDTVWLFKILNEELGYLDFPEGDRAGIIMMICWAINNNAHYICFWMLMHIVCDAELLINIREEIDQCTNKDGTCDLYPLLHHCPYLEAVWNECLRLYNASTTVRQAISSCKVGGRTINEGDQIFAPARNWQLEESFFGNSPRLFSADRWLDNNLTRSKGFTPFGGGHTYCPGRFFAQREAYMLIAMTLNRFDLKVANQQGQLVPNPKVAEVQLNLPAPAAMQPVDGVMVVITDRSH